jgi:hypothetical protein
MAVNCECVAEDVAAASASVLYHSLPEITREPQAIYDRFKAHIGAAIRAYCDGLQGWGQDSAEKKVETPQPSLNTLSVSIFELRDKINNIHHLTGPELKKFLDTYEFPFSTMNAILAFGRRLLKDVIEAKELVAKLCETVAPKHEQVEPNSEMNQEERQREIEVRRAYSPKGC